MKMDAREAADAIRDDVDHTAVHRMRPEDIHRMRFVGEVCQFLDLEDSPENMEMVFGLLKDKDIEIHEGHEWPKWMTNEAGKRAIVNEDDAEAFKSWNDKPAELDEDGNPVPQHEDAEYGSIDTTTGMFHRSEIIASRKVKPPAYEAGAGPMEPGAPNRPTAPAPEASPVSDNNVNARGRTPAEQMGDNRPTPNPQPKHLTIDNQREQLAVTEKDARAVNRPLPDSAYEQV